MKSKILVIRFSSLGDVVLSSASVLNLKIGYPESSIFFLTKERHAPIAHRMIGVNQVVTVSDTPGLIEIIKLVARIESEEFDIIVDLQGNFRSFLVRNLLYAGQKVVYARDRIARQRIVDYKDFPATVIHTIDKYNECINQLGLFPAARRPVITANRTPSFDSSNKQIVVAPEASFSNKQWPVERFAEVAIKLHKSHGAKIIWATTSRHKEQVNWESKIEKKHLVHLVDCPIDKLTDIIGNSELCLANDSGIAHLSSAVGTPVVAVFGPTHPALGFAPQGLFDKIIEVDEYCRPCSLHGDKPCFREERFCFTRISTERVAAEAHQILEMRKNRVKALFADRDGTVIIDKPFDSDPEKIEFEPGSVDGLLRAQKLGFKIVIVSNQSGVARGYFNISDAERFNRVLVQLLNQKGVHVDGIYYCPHYAKGVVANFAKACHCRKPAPGMAEKAARELNLDLQKSYVIGDKMDDFNLGRIIGGTSFLVKTGQGQDYVNILRKSVKNADNLICENLLEAVRRIEELEKKRDSEVQQYLPTKHP